MTISMLRRLCSHSWIRLRRYRGTDEDLLGRVWELQINERFAFCIWEEDIIKEEK